MKYLLGLMALSVLLSACAPNPKSALISNDPSKWETELKGSVEKLSSDEKDVLAGYLVRAKLGEALGGTGGVPIGTTVGDAIDNQVRWKAD